MRTGATSPMKLQVAKDPETRERERERERMQEKKRARQAQATDRRIRNIPQEPLYHFCVAKFSIVIHPILGTCSLASCPTSVAATALLCKNPRCVNIIILSLHRDNMTFVRRWFLMNPGDEVRTIETTMWSSSFPWKESTLNTVFSHAMPPAFNAPSIAFRWAS